jgi:hypothetical protein
MQAQARLVCTKKWQFVNPLLHISATIPNPNFDNKKPPDQKNQPKLDNPGYVDYESNSMDAQAWLIKMLSGSLVLTYSKYALAADIWAALELSFTSMSLSHCATLHTKWSSLHYGGFKAKKLDTFLSHFDNLVAELEGVGAGVVDKDQVKQSLIAIRPVKELAGAATIVEGATFLGGGATVLRVQNWLRQEEQQYDSEKATQSLGASGNGASALQAQSDQ